MNRQFDLFVDLVQVVQLVHLLFHYQKHNHFEELHPDFIKVVEERSEELVKAHTRFAKYLGAKRFESVSPVLPPDILGVYVLIPKPTIEKKTAV